MTGRSSQPHSWSSTARTTMPALILFALITVATPARATGGTRKSGDLRYSVHPAAPRAIRRRRVREILTISRSLGHRPGVYSSSSQPFWR